MKHKALFVLLAVLLLCFGGCSPKGQTPAVDDVAQAAPEAGLVEAWEGEMAEETPEEAVGGAHTERMDLYDENGVEIAAFYGISDFSQYVISGGSFTEPGENNMPIALTTYAIGGRTITTNNWILGDDNRYYYEIENDLISANVTTCNILILFAPGTDFEYEAAQEAGKLILYTDAAPLDNIVIDSIQVTRN